MPAAALLLSPMTDLTVTGNPADPLVSPIFADLSGLPPLLIQADFASATLEEPGSSSRRTTVHSARSPENRRW